MSNSTETTTSSKVSQILRSDGVLGTLVAVFSILIAFVGYQSTLIGAKSSEFELSAERILSVANREYLDAGQNVLFDMSAYDDYYAALGVDDEAADNYYASFSDALIQNLESPDLERNTLFDDIYYDEMYQPANDCFVEADDMFILGNTVGDIADKHQLIMFIFAIGLALAAWAALLPATSNVRLTFVIFAIIVLIVGLILYIPLATSAAAFPVDTAAIDLYCLE